MEYFFIPVHIDPENKNPTYTQYVYQWDYGLYLKITGVDIPNNTPVAFSNRDVCGNALRMITTTSDGVTTVKVPDILLAEQEFCFGNLNVYAWITLVGESGSKTIYKIVIPVHARPKPEDYTDPGTDDPFGDALEQVKQYADQAEQSATAAETAQAGAEKAYQDTIEAVEQIKEDNMAMAEKIAIKPTASGTDIVTEDSAYWRLLDFSAQGWTEQVQTEGNQLFDASKLPTKSQGGATVTNNGDGSFTISGSGNLSEKLSLTYSYTHEETVKLIKSGMIYLTGGDVYPRVGIALFVNNKAVVSLNSGQSANVLEEYIEDESSYLYLSFYGESGQAIIPGTIRPILYQDGDGTWEPFSGRYPSPRPEIRTNQLFDASKLESKTQGGAIVTNNGDGSFAISGEGNLTETFSHGYDYTHSDLVNFFREGKLYLDVGFKTMPYVYFNVKKQGQNLINANNELRETVEVTITKEILDDPETTFRIGFYGTQGNEITPQIICPMLYQDGDGAWEPYGTVEAWPQPIVSAAEDAKTEEGKYPVTFSITGKNLINFDEYYNGFSGADGYEGNANEINQIKINLPKSLIGKQVCFSAKIKISGDLTGSSVATIIGGVRKIGNSITNKNDFEISKVVFKPETEEDSIYITYGSNKENTVFFKDLMLSLGEEVGFEPYKNPQTVTITSDRPLTKWDSLEKRDGKWGWVYKSEETEFDGSEDETWNVYLDPNSKLERHYIALDKSKLGSKCFCNFYPYELNANKKYVCFISGSAKNFIVMNSNFKTKEEFVENLKINHLRVVYETESEEWVELSPEEQSALNALETYYPTTVIINSANMEMKLKYVADPENYLRKNYQEKLDQIDVINEKIAVLQNQIIKEV